VIRGRGGGIDRGLRTLLGLRQMGVKDIGIATTVSHFFVSEKQGKKYDIPEDTLCYLCGNPYMLKGVYDILIKKRGFPSRHF
jgi:NAD(P)H-flavin reductase